MSAVEGSATIPRDGRAPHDKTLLRKLFPARPGSTK